MYDVNMLELYPKELFKTVDYFLVMYIPLEILRPLVHHKFFGNIEVLLGYIYNT